MSFAVSRRDVPVASITPYPSALETYQERSVDRYYTRQQAVSRSQVVKTVSETQAGRGRLLSRTPYPRRDDSLTFKIACSRTVTDPFAVDRSIRSNKISAALAPIS